MNHKKVLGRGLGALIPQRPEAPEAHSTPGLAEIPISQIQPNPYQPRKTFNEASIEELARSVREHGIVQPLVVTRAGDKYKLIAGERRFRAAQKAGLTTVPALIKEMMQEGDALQIALIENIQREDLTRSKKRSPTISFTTTSSSPRRRSPSGWGRNARPSPTSSVFSSCPTR